MKKGKEDLTIKVVQHIFFELKKENLKKSFEQKKSKNNSKYFIQFEYEKYMKFIRFLLILYSFVIHLTFSCFHKHLGHMKTHM